MIYLNDKLNLIDVMKSSCTETGGAVGALSRNKINPINSEKF